MQWELNFHLCGHTGKLLKGRYFDETGTID